MKKNDSHDENYPYDGRRVRQERDGVIYEPGGSGAAPRRQSRQDYGLGDKPKQTLRRTSGKQKKRRSQFALFYIITLLVGVLVCIVIFAIMFNNFSKKREAGADPAPPNLVLQSPEPPSGNMSELQQVTGMIVSVEGNTFLLRDVETNKTYVLAAEGATTMKNRYGQEIVFAEFAVGNIVDATFDKQDNVLKSVMMNATANAWEFKLIKGVGVDPEQKFITMGNEHYFYDESLICLYKDAPAKPDDLAAVDVVSLSGYKDRVLYIEINKSHGQLQFINGENIKEGTLEVDTAVFMPLQDAGDMEVLEGPHQIIVKGTNIELFTKDIIVETGAATIVDLKDVQYKSSILTVTSSVSGYELTIDGEKKDASGPIVIDFGTYLLEAKKDGYLPFKTTIQVTEPESFATVELEQEVVMRKFTLSTIPEGAEVYIDNGLAGVTPLEEMLTDGIHSVTVRKSGYSDTTITVVVNENARMNYSITMQAIPPAYEPVMPSVPEQSPAGGGAPITVTPEPEGSSERPVIETPVY